VITPLLMLSSFFGVILVKSLNKEMNDEDEKEETRSSTISKSQSQAKEHVEQLERLKEKVGGFYSCSGYIFVILIFIFEA
jgi:uncharacterized membrane protein